MYYTCSEHFMSSLTIYSLPIPGGWLHYQLFVLVNVSTLGLGG